MRSFTLIFIFSVAIHWAGAQSIRIEMGSGMGSFKMDDLKELNATYLKLLPVKAKITDDFPVQPFYNVAVIYQTASKVYYGLTGSFASTGSRVSYKDYSGELIFDNILTYYSPGIRAGWQFAGNKVSFAAENNLSYSFSKLKMKEKVLTTEEERTFLSDGFQTEPGLRVSYRISIFELSVKAGYLIDFSGDNKLDGESDQVLYLGDSKTKIKNDWSGFRLGASLGIILWNRPLLTRF